MKISIHSDPASLDPRKGGDASKAIVQFMLYEGLTRFSDKGEIEPAGAERIEISVDKKRYTFHLRQHKWSDGSLVTAHDYANAWKASLTPTFNASFAHLLYCIKNAEKVKVGQLPLEELGVSAKDDKTLIVDLERPTPYFLELTAFYSFFPFKSEDIYNGPFKLSSWKRNQAIYLEKNSNYWGKEQVRLDKIQVNILDNENTVLQMFEKGELDMAGSPLSALPIEALPILHREGKLHTQAVAGSTFCAFNTQSFPFSNVNMRRAFALAINRQKIVGSITQIDEEAATGVVPTILKKGKSDPLFNDGDVDAARMYFQKGLQEMNIKDLKGVTYKYCASELNEKIAELLQSEWKEALGVDVRIEKLERKVLLNNLDARDFQIGQAFWLAFYNDQMNIFERFRLKGNVKNFPGWENEEYISLIDRSFIEEERQKTLEKAEALLVDEMPLTVLYHWNYGYLKNPNLKGYFISPIGDIYFTFAFFENK